MIWDRKHKQ